MNKQWVGLLTGLVTLIFSVGASAGLITYDLRGYVGSLDNTETFLSNGVEMTAIAQTKRNGSWRARGDLFQTRRGLGVYTGGFDSTQIDGWGRDEAIVFRFDSVVTLTDASFGSMRFFDDFNLAVYDKNGWTEVLEDKRSLTDDYSGSRFRFWADSILDDFYVGDLTFRAEVPEPATLLLMGLGIAAVGISRRSSTKA